MTKENAAIEIRLPDLGEVDDVRVVQWLCDVGATVAEDEDLVEVETEKTTFVVPSPAAGRLAQVAAAEGATVDRGGLLGRIEQLG
jgi:2-oxoglutarate dehydrogenase E2 component (dihydrolipoamide succinyltransferase)